MTTGAKKAAGTNPLGLTALGNLFTCMMVLLLSPGSIRYIPAMDRVDWIVAILLGPIQISAGYALYNIGVQRIAALRAEKNLSVSLWLENIRQ